MDFIFTLWTHAILVGVLVIYTILATTAIKEREYETLIKFYLQRFKKEIPKKESLLTTKKYQIIQGE